jgi:hypothetical protein
VPEVGGTTGKPALWVDVVMLSLAVYAARRTMPNGFDFFRICPDRRVIEPA